MDRKVIEVDWVVLGSIVGLNMLEFFCYERLKYFGFDRNNLNKNVFSNFLFWIKFGNMIYIGILSVYYLNEF